MKLTDLLMNLDYECMRGAIDREVDQVVYDSRKEAKDLSENSLFICIEGAVFDGHSFAADMVGKGVKVLVVSKSVEMPEDADVTIIKVENTRYAMAFISAAYFGHLIW